MHINYERNADLIARWMNVIVKIWTVRCFFAHHLLCIQTSSFWQGPPCSLRVTVIGMASPISSLLYCDTTVQANVKAIHIFLPDDEKASSGFVLPSYFLLTIELRQVWAGHLWKRKKGWMAWSYLHIAVIWLRFKKINSIKITHSHIIHYDTIG